MNLIEQLGGYGQLKGYMDGALKGMQDGYCYKFNTVLGRQKLLNMRDVKKLLLEYRRQHNIFEVGDKVKAKDHQFGFDELFRIDDFFANDDGVNLAVLDDGDCYPISFLEHATDAEIQAGRRL